MSHRSNVVMDIKGMIGEEQYAFLEEYGGRAKILEFLVQAVAFDVKHGTATTAFLLEKIIQQNAEILANPDHAENGVKHRTSLTSSIVDGLNKAKDILKEKYDLDLKNASLYDIGTGTGKPAIIAKMSEYGFDLKNVTGIEYNPILLDIAKQNKESCGLGNDDSLSFRFADAAAFDSYDGEFVVVYMYNPFDDVIMKDVEKNLRKSDKPVIIIYNKPEQAAVFEKNGWKTEDVSPASDPDNRLTIFSYGMEEDFQERQLETFMGSDAFDKDQKDFIAGHSLREQLKDFVDKTHDTPSASLS